MFFLMALECPLNLKEIQPVHPKGNQSWIFIGRTDAEAETSVLCPPDVKNWLIGKDPWCWERLKAGGEGDNRVWDWLHGITTQRTWVGINSRSWWWSGRPGVLQSMGKQRVGHDWVTEVMSPHCEVDSHALNQVHSCRGHPCNPPASQIWTSQPVLKPTTSGHFHTFLCYY